MAQPFNVKKLLPLTEPMYYTLLALAHPQHGYGIMQTVEKLSNGRVKVGAGTLYAVLARFLKHGIIERRHEESSSDDNDRRKTYNITKQGNILLYAEYQRILSMLNDGKEIIEEYKYNKTDKN